MTQDKKELWDAEEFSTFAIALHRGTTGWEAATAAKLDVSKKTLQRWAQDGAPLAVRDELRRISGIDEESKIAFPRDEWIVGDSQPYPDPDAADKIYREYIIHTRAPRFIARIVAIDDEGNPVVTEDPADILSGVTFVTADDVMFCEIQWIDARPPVVEDYADLFQQASKALDLCSTSDTNDTGMRIH